MRRWHKLARPIEQRCHLFVPQLGESAIELANCEEVCRRIEANGLVSFPPQLLERVRRRDRDRKHQPRRLSLPCGTQGDPHCGARRDAVIDDDRRASGDVDPRAITEPGAAAPFDLLQCRRLRPLQIFGRDVEANDQSADR